MHEHDWESEIQATYERDGGFGEQYPAVSTQDWVYPAAARPDGRIRLAEADLHDRKRAIDAVDYHGSQDVQSSWRIS